MNLPIIDGLRIRNVKASRLSNCSLSLWRKEAKILFLGLDNAGKTTLLRVLKDARVVQHEPTRHPTSEELIIGRVRFKAFDLGGHQICRKLWRDYYTQVDGIVYLVDSTDRGRFQESRKELDAIIMDESMDSVPILILGNKIDLPYAVSQEEFRYELGLTFAENSERPVGIFMCSVVRQMGYGEGIEWLSQNI